MSLSLHASQPDLPDFLPGRFTIEPGRARDYDALAMFHYCAARPATFAGVWVIRFIPRAASSGERIAAVGVLSYPVPSCAPRERWFGLSRSRRDNLVFANANLRTISRVVVHPQFRSLNLSTTLIRFICNSCPTRFIEAIARMGRVHPMFERAGMTRVPPAHADEPAYYVLDRSISPSPCTQGEGWGEGSLAINS